MKLPIETLLARIPLLMVEKIRQHPPETGGVFFFIDAIGRRFFEHSTVFLAVPSCAKLFCDVVVSARRLLLVVLKFIPLPPDFFFFFFFRILTRKGTRGPTLSDLFSSPSGFFLEAR